MSKGSRKETVKKHAIINEVFGLILLLASVFLVISLATFRPENYPLFSRSTASGVASTGLVGTFLAQYLVFALGKSAYSIPFILFFWSASFFMQKIPEKKFLKMVGFFIFTFAASGFLALFEHGELRFQNGGYVGFYFARVFETYFGAVGGYFISGFLLFLSFILATEFLIFPMVKLLALAFWTVLVLIGQKIQEGLKALAEIEWKMPQIKLPKFERKAAEKLSESQAPKTTSELVSFLRKENLVAARKKAKGEPLTPEEPKPAASSLFRGPVPELKITKYAPSAVPQSDEEAMKEHERRKDMLEKFLSKKKEKPQSAPELPSQKIAVDPAVARKAEALKEEMKKEAMQAAGITETADDSKGDERKTEIIAQETPAETPEVIETPRKPYTTPPTSLFDMPEVETISDDDIVANSQLLERTLADFGIEGKVVEVEQGPVITRYEILPAPGVRVSSIASLENDLALAMKAATVRIIAPIPGKAAVGIELPNNKQAVVRMRELLELEAFETAKRKFRLPLLLGKNANGSPLFADLADMPHLLVAGATGSGKTVCMNSIITGLVMCHTPAELRFVMIDPKMVEMAGYNALPHMLLPVMTDSKKAAGTLEGVIMEMENRYAILATAGVRNIASFNSREPQESEQLNGKPLPATMPYIVVVIDEIADLMIVARDKIEASIQRLAQLSRAVGIHLVLATQKPSVEVITGVIKANLPARIAFQVASKIDSRVILDVNGADKLLGKGDMLFQPPGAPKPSRAQCTFISDDEIKRILEHVRGSERPMYESALTEVTKSAGSAGGANMERDELYDEAVRVIIDTQQASVSTLQRRLGLGYARAARIMDMMQIEGIVGPPRGAKPREILIGRDQVEAEAVTPEN